MSEPLHNQEAEQPGVATGMGAPALEGAVVVVPGVDGQPVAGSSGCEKLESQASPVASPGELGAGVSEPVQPELPDQAVESGEGCEGQAQLETEAPAEADVASTEAEPEEDSAEAIEPEAETEEVPEDLEVAVKNWYILKVQVNREDSIREALLRRIKIEGLEGCFDEIIVPTEDVVEFNKSGKRRVVKRKLYPGYILVKMAITDDTWFLVRETPGVGDFTGSGGKPTPMDTRDVERILRLGVSEDAAAGQIKTAIPFKIGDRVRVKDGNFQNFEGDVESIDHANGRITVVITIFNRSTPVELEHWQLESV